MLNWLFPQRCPICDELVKQPYCCDTCYKKIKFIKQPYCYSCGKPLQSEQQEYCADCRKYPKTFDGNCALFLYDDVTKHSLNRFKFHNRREYAEFYAQESMRRLGAQLLTYHIDVVLPVPVHPKKKRERGYNQAALIGRKIADMLNVPFWENGLKRRIYTLPQKELNNIERLKNLENAFLIGENSVKLYKILLVDDIYTTGTTLEACSRVLKACGADKVYGLTIAIGEGY